MEHAARSHVRRAARRAAAVGGFVGFVILALAAYVADLAQLFMGHAEALSDVATGVAFGVAAAFSVCPVPQRLLIGSVGVLWLLASLVDVPSWHQGALVVALLLFPSGRPGSSWRWLLLLSLAALLIPGWVGRAWSASVFLLLSSVLATERMRRAERSMYPWVAACLVGGVLAVTWAVQDLRLDGLGSRGSLLAYQAALIVVAVGHVVATHRIGRRSRRRLGSLLAAHREESFRSRITVLESLLGEALGDPGLRIRLIPPQDGYPARLLASERGWRTVYDGVEPVAALGLSRPHWDSVTLQAADDAVRLVVRSMRLQADLDRHLERRRAARSRLVETRERQRTWLSSRLEAEVLKPLSKAVAALSSRGPTVPARASDLDVVVEQLEAAAAEVKGIVGAVPPVPLGDGALAQAVASLTERSAVPAAVHVAQDACGDAGAETALYYACAEALSNVVKHAHASQVEVRLVRDGDWLELTVRDDGRGGADPTGSGLLGLRDRLAARDGRLWVESVEGVGTTVCAGCPTRSWSTDR